MNNVLWQVFKTTGNIEAYLYVKEYQQLESEFNEFRENEVKDDNTKHSGDCS